MKLGKGVNELSTEDILSDARQSRSRVDLTPEPTVITVFVYLITPDQIWS